MSFPVDTSEDWRWVDGVEDAIYEPPDGAFTSCKAKPTELTYADLTGGVLGVAPGDRVFIVWGLTEPAINESKLVLGDDVYTVVGTAFRGDAAQQRVGCRKDV